MRRKLNDRAKKAVLQFRLTHTEYEALRLSAFDNGRSISQEVAFRLHQFTQQMQTLVIDQEVRF